VAIAFRRLERADLPRLARWQGEPHVARWWGPPPDPPALEREYGPGIDGSDPTQFFIAELDGTAIGLIQRYRYRDDPAANRQIGLPGAAGIDYYIGEPQLIGQGIGPRLISQFVEQLFVDYPDADCVAVGVLQKNQPSWRALEKSGFKRLRSQHLESDDPWDTGPGYVYVRWRSPEGAE
jgi:RimJ/RimL family protein N-acetyltransferase